MITFIGIDPGMSGGLAAITFDQDDGSVKIEVRHVSDDEGDLLDWFVDQCLNESVAAIEQVSGFMASREGDSDDGEKKNRASAHTMFTFGRSVGMLRTAAIAAGLVPGDTLLTVPPAVWQRGVGVDSRRKVGRQHVETRSQFKSRLRDHARQIFPGVKGVDLKTCDALLIAEWLRRKTRGNQGYHTEVCQGRP